jgi:gamma-D-glutamyl-L-lysine dipeptidyl-peptidase
MTESSARDAASAVRRVSAPVADVRAEPRDDAERVNQALLGTPVDALEAGPEGWARVRLPDYTGWMRERDLIPAAPAPPTRNVRVAAQRADLRILGADGAPNGETTPAYAGADLPLAPDAAAAGMEGVIIVTLPDGREAIADPADLAPAEPDYRGTAAAVLDTARGFLDTPYLWGGMTQEGIDCSGLTQIAYRVHGYTIPRDADEQFTRLGRAVEPDALQPGDLLFFGPTPDRVTHVMLYAGGDRVIHASSAAKRVVTQGIRPGAPDYHARRDRYLGARRVIDGCAPSGGDRDA